jgi:hypothetical protein
MSLTLASHMSPEVLFENTFRDNLGETHQWPRKSLSKRNEKGPHLLGEILDVRGIVICAVICSAEPIL